MREKVDSPKEELRENPERFFEWYLGLQDDVVQHHAFNQALLRAAAE